jgi:hypothetical protein
MKKHKSVVAILLAVMMIFTMMPMMAFAAAGSWDGGHNNYSKDGKNYQAVHNWDKATGTVVAELSTEGYSSDAAATIPVEEAGQYFTRNLNGATVKGFPKVMTYTEYKNLGDTTYNTLTLVAPSDVSNYSTLATADKTYDWTIGTGYEMTVVKSDYDDAKKYENQTMTVAFSVVATSEKKGASAADAVLTGGVASVQVTVQAQGADYNQIALYVDEVAKGKEFTNDLTYTGAEQTIVASTVPGYSVKYYLFDAASGTYKAADKISFKDATSKAVLWRWEIVDKDGKVVAGTGDSYSTTVGSATAPSFEFDQDGNYGYGTWTVEGATYDANDYVKVVAEKTNKAAWANEAEFKEFFKDFFVVDATAPKANPNRVSLEMSFNDELTTAEKTELLKKYEVLAKNFGITAENVKTKVTVVAANDDLTVVTNWDVDDEVEFTKSVTKKTYKAKVLKKKAKSFTVHAEAANGATVKYKLINAPEKITINKTSGKITLKKGLKKGTYKIKVKAYIPGSYVEGVGVVSETHSITIKVK